MGEVYLAEDVRLHRKVALKILPAELAAKKDRMRRSLRVRITSLLPVGRDFALEI